MKWLDDVSDPLSNLTKSRLYVRNGYRSFGGKSFAAKLKALIVLRLLWLFADPEPDDRIV